MGLFIICQLLGIVFLILTIVYGSGIKESDLVDGQEISGMALLSIIFLVGPWIYVICAGIV